MTLKSFSLTVLLLAVIIGLYLTFRPDPDPARPPRGDHMHAIPADQEGPGPAYQVLERSDGRAARVGLPGSTAYVEVPRPFPAAHPPIPKGPVDFLGAKACAECHREKFDSFKHTAHHLTSSLPSAGTIKGSFAEGSNELKSGNGDLRFEMRQDPNGFTQFIDLGSFERSYPFDIVTGSGKMGQTYLYWLNDCLYQLHVSYFTETDQWINSPGNPDGAGLFARPIAPNCLECHATYFSWNPGSLNQYRKDDFILGISCERCHGPGRNHVDYHKKFPAAKEPKHIVNPGELPRERSNDVCAQCHSGLGQPLQHPFAFRPGEDISAYFRFHNDADKVRGGVHTDNQLARLKKSRCFTQSEMTCVDCHNPHQQERGDLALFSRRCLECHASKPCGLKEKLGDRLDANCIDCHLPKRRDDKMGMAGSGGEIRFPLLRDHHIAVRRDETEQVLKKWGITLP